MPTRPIHLDACILGGGVAGLWALAHLRRVGYHATLIELDTLGGGPHGQTIASQGIIHGGIKYALSGAASAASRAIAAMPDIWRRSLAPLASITPHDSQLHASPHNDPVLPLASATVLSESQLLWTTPGVTSRLAGAAASKVIRTPVERLASNDRPPPFSSTSGIDVYRVAEPVLDSRSVVAALALAAGHDRIITLASHRQAEERPHHDPRLSITTGPNGVASLAITPADSDSPITITAARFIFTAGAGNESLLSRAFQSTTPGFVIPRMQRRPLHMLMLRAAALPAIFGHCVGMSDKPRITITTSRDAAGRAVWYIGGLIAEQGVARSRDQQIAAAKLELAACLPWLNLAPFNPQWATWHVDRAEGLSPDGSRPDEPVVSAVGNVIAAWPTKLAFAPLVASRIESLLREASVLPTDPTAHPPMLFQRTAPAIAMYPWEREEVAWTS